MSIERRTEIPPDHKDPDYENVEFDAERIADGGHRRFVGGFWDEMGQLQLDFLREQGLQPEHRFLDVGCGTLRAGRKLVDYLDPGHYYGTDINHELLETGYRVELTDEQRARLPEANLRSTDRFDNDFGVQFDMAIAQSVFTHIPLNHMRLCLYRVAKVMRPGGRFYVTFFERGRDFPLDNVPKSGRMWSERNAFWYYRSDMTWVAKRSPWEVRYIGKWGHPRNQRMVEYTRLAD
ncbi:class I SAM-dependent methyltransferase [Nocardioides sp. CN2-186]|uniref:class I SAM-dependent methyltransferase n=1 Tax=Nocardioides tweenelious TaxID=3156607 RepID=UPI0032B321BB